MDKIDDYIPVDGQCKKIDFAVQADGQKPARKELAKMLDKEQRKFFRFMALFRQYSLTGWLPGNYMDSYKGSVIKKFKSSETYPYRVPFFEINNNVFLTHLFKKKGNKEIQKEIKKAERIMQEHKSR